MRLCALFLTALATTTVRADATFDAAMALVHAKRYPEARVALQQVVAAQPKNAAAWHQLGMVWRARHDTTAYEQAAQCLASAVALEPNNPIYLGDYGGTEMELADRTRSISAAITGRDAMQKAETLAPDDLDVREGLFLYYLRAPFFVGGSTAKADSELQEIRRRNPSRAISLAVLTKANDKDYAGAFALCDQELATHPDDYTALYQYGRTASVSGQKLERGLACLQKALTIEPPGPTAPAHTYVWGRIGDIQQKLGHPQEARDAYKTALKLDPNNRLASSALEKLP